MEITCNCKVFVGALLIERRYIKYEMRLCLYTAVPYLKLLDAGFPPRRPGFASGHHVGFVVDKAALGQVFSEYFSSPYKSFHQFLHHHNHPGLA
jgi:hypothetical protein